MTGPVTDADLARWRELAEAATEGPWVQATSSSAYLLCPRCELGNYVARAMDNGHYEHRHELLSDAEFIAAARDAVPRLLALVASQAERSARVRALAADWVAMGAVDVYESAGELGECILATLDGAQ